MTSKTAAAVVALLITFVASAFAAEPPTRNVSLMAYRVRLGCTAAPSGMDKTVFGKWVRSCVAHDPLVWANLDLTETKPQAEHSDSTIRYRFEWIPHSLIKGESLSYEIHTADGLPYAGSFGLEIGRASCRERV